MGLSQCKGISAYEKPRSSGNPEVSQTHLTISAILIAFRKAIYLCHLDSVRFAISQFRLSQIQQIRLSQIQQFWLSQIQLSGLSQIAKPTITLICFKIQFSANHEKEIIREIQIFWNLSKNLWNVWTAFIRSKKFETCGFYSRQKMLWNKKV